MKGGLALIGLLAIFGGGAGLYLWAFHGGNETPLTADAILVFDSPKAVAARYGYIGKTYTAAVPSFPEETHPSNGIPNRTDGFDHYFRIRFATGRPATQVRAEALAELNRVRVQKGKRIWNSAALNQAPLYTISADIDMTAAKRGHAGPDVSMFQRPGDDMLAGLKALFEPTGAAGKLAVDPGDPHILSVTVFRNTGAMSGDMWGTAPTALTMKFSLDWKTAEISIPDAGGGSATVTATTQEATALEGPYLLQLTTTGIVNNSVQARVLGSNEAPYMFAGMRDQGLINPSIPVYLHRDGDFAGKAYFGGKTYKLQAASQNGVLKLFLGDAAVFSVDPAKPSSSFMRYGSESVSSVFVIYTATLAKVDAHGKQAQLATNFDSLGSVPETVTGAPNVWGTYFDLRQRQYTAQDIVSDPVLHQVFGGHPQGSSALGAAALSAATPRQARPAIVPAAHGLGRATPASSAAPDPQRFKTDAEIEKEMQDKLRKRRY